MRNLPFPKTVSGWLLSFMLIILSFNLYYREFSNEVVQQYYGNENMPFYQNAVDIQSISVDVQIPSFIAYYAARAMRVKITAKDELSDVVVVVTTQGEPLSIFCNKATDAFSVCDKSENVLKFGSFASGEIKTKTIWVMANPRSKTEAKQTQYGFKLFVDGKLVPVKWGVGANLKSKIDNSKSFRCFILGTLLLPPWSNGIIPAFVLLFCFLFEHKIQPGQKFRSIQSYVWIREITHKVVPIRYIPCKIVNGKQFNSLIRRHWVQALAMLMVSILYFSATVAVYFWVADDKMYYWALIIFSIILWVFISILFDNTDINVDPLYVWEQDTSKPQPWEIQLNAALLVMQRELPKIASQRKQTRKNNRQISQVADRLETFLSLYENQLQEKTQVALSQELHQIVETLDRFGDYLLEKCKERPVDVTSLDLPYKHTSLLSDDGLVQLFKRGVSEISDEQFSNKLQESSFALCILSLFARANEQKWDDALIIGQMSLRGWIQEPVFWEKDPKLKQSLIERWLDEVPEKYCLSFMQWMFTFKSDQVGYYLFEVIVPKCSPQNAVMLLAEYLESYRKSGKSTDIQWHNVLQYFLETEPPEDLLQPDILSAVWYPSTDATHRSNLWKLAEDVNGTFSAKKWKNIYTSLLQWLCLLPVEQRQFLAKKIYDFYRDDKTLDDGSDLAKFIAEGWEDSTDEKGLIWCKEKNTLKYNLPPEDVQEDE